MPPKKAATAAKAKKAAPAKKAPVSTKAAAKKAPAKEASTKKADQKRARSPTRSDASDDETLKTPLAKRSKRQAESAGEWLTEGEVCTPAVATSSAPVRQAKAKKATLAKDTVDLFGKFDIYAKELPYLASAGYYKDSPDFQYLLELMKECQANSDFTARATIPKSYRTSDGAFQIKVLVDPISGEEYEISLEAMRLKGEDEPTLEASMSFDGGCALSDAKGLLSLHRCWIKRNSDEDLEEIFDCTFNIDASGSSLYQGHGSDLRISIECWAIRAVKYPSGEEIGLNLN